MTAVFADPIPYFLELEPLVDGTPRVRITVYNVPETQTIRIRRKAAGESWTVPGLHAQRVTDTAVFVDWFAPFNVPITYTVTVGGVDQHTATVTLSSDTAWLQDPLQPNKAVPVLARGQATGHLSLTSESLQKIDYQAATSEHMVMGAKYPTLVGGQRQGASAVPLTASSYDRDTDNAFRELISETPILVFRTIADQWPLPPLCYLNAQVSELPLTVHYGGELARWNFGGNLVAAVAQAVVSGMITYADVDALLASYTYGEVQAAAGSTTYLDWQKNPLIFSTL